MQISEKELEKMLCDELIHPESLYLLGEKGFHIGEISDNPDNKLAVFRQVDLHDYGRADIITAQRDTKLEDDGNVYPIMYINIFELKITKLCSDDFEQVARYCTGVRSLLLARYGSISNYRIRGYLIGPEISSGYYLHNMLPIQLITYKYGFSGFKFHTSEGGWYKPSFKAEKVSWTAYKNTEVLNVEKVF